MILTDLQVEAVRRFASPIRVEGLGPGLNILAAHNEAGKSTVLMALRAALMLRYSSKAQPVKDLFPYGGGSPHVGVAFQWQGQSCWLEKKFGKGSMARLDLGPERFDGDEAEERLQSLFELEKVGKSEAAGLWNALLVQQGESFSQPPLLGAGRASLQNCLQETIQSVTGTAEASAMLALVSRQLAQYQTATGKVTGRLRQVQEESERAQAQVATLEARRHALQEDITALDQIRRTLSQSESPEWRRQAEEKLVALRQTRDQLRGLVAEEQVAQAQLRAADMRLQSIHAEQERRHAHRAEIARLEQALAHAQAGQADLTPQEQAATQHLAHAQAGWTKAANQHQQARGVLVRVMQQAELARSQQALEQERAVFERAQAACTRLEKAQADLHVMQVDAGFMRRVAKALQAVQQAEARMQAQATRFVADLRPDAAGTVWLDGQPCPSGPQALTDVTTLVVDGVGRFTITPATEQREALHTALATAQAALDGLLHEVGCQTVEQAETRHEARKQAEREVAEASAVCMALLSVPDATKIVPALAVLRNGLNEREALFAREQAAQADLPDGDASAQMGVEQATLLEQNAAMAADAARQHAEDALHQHHAARTRLEQALAQTRQQHEALQRYQRELAVWQERETDAALLARLAQDEQEKQHAQAELARIEQMRQQEAPLSVVEQGIARRERDMEREREQVKTLSMDKRERETRIRQAEGDGLDEQLAAAQRHASQLESEQAACERERAALALLESTLLKMETTQTERYLAPLVKAMQPAFSALFQGATLEMDTQFALTGLTRQRAEEVKDLSDGTREQIAVLVRLGFAELLHKRGAPAILVLDDALSFSDSQRLETLFDVLSDAATRLQIVLLTCHAEQFAPLRGRMLSLRPLEHFTAPR